MEEEEELQASAAWKLAEQEAWVESINVTITTTTTTMIMIIANVIIAIVNTIKTTIFQATTT